MSPLAVFARKAAGLGPVSVSPKRKYIALGVAAVSDAIQWAVIPMVVEGAPSPIEDALDVVTAVILIGILGWNWRLALAFGAELVPGFDLFPSWAAMVLTFPTTQGAAAPALAAPSLTVPGHAPTLPVTQPMEPHDPSAPAAPPAPPVLYTRRTR
jgi:hypothetical protein